jgi:hypothetical protein
MKSNITRLQIIFFGIFLVGSASVLAYHYFWVWPKARCEAKPDHAWAAKWMTCARIMPLEVLTMKRSTTLPPINTDTRRMDGPSASHPKK